MLLVGWASSVSAQQIGAVIELTPDAFGTPPDGDASLLSIGRGLVSDELIQTLAEANVRIQFLDETDLRIGARSMILLDRMIYDPDQGLEELVIEVAAGVARFISGNIDPAAFIVNTPVALIGVRGTDFVVYVEASGRTTIAVLEGAVIVTPTGRPPVIVGAGQSIVIEPDQSIPPVAQDGLIIPDDPGLGPIPTSAVPPAPPGPARPLRPGAEFEVEVLQVIPRSGFNPLDPTLDPAGAGVLFVQGFYTGGGGCGINSTTLFVIGGSVSLNPFGVNGPTAFAVSGTTAQSISSDLILFGNGGHSCKLVFISSSEFDLFCDDGGGSTCVEPLSN